MPLFLAVGDGVAANYGSKCVDSSRLALTVGTSAALRVVLPQPPPPGQLPRGLWCYRIDANRVVVGGALTDGGSVVGWARELMGINTPADFDEVLQGAAAVGPDEHGLTVLPFLGPERSMGWHDGAQGSIVGVTSRTTRPHLLRSILDGVALRLRAVAKAVFPFADPQAVVVASGGALEDNALWRQILADALGRPLVMEAASGDATAKAANASAAAKYATPTPPHLEPVASAHPDPGRMEVYTRLATAQGTAYGSILGPSSTFNQWYPAPDGPLAVSAEEQRLARHRERTNAIRSTYQAASGIM